MGTRAGLRYCPPLCPIYAVVCLMHEQLRCWRLHEASAAPCLATLLLKLSREGIQ